MMPPTALWSYDSGETARKLIRIIGRCLKASLTAGHGHPHPVLGPWPFPRKRKWKLTCLVVLLNAASTMYSSTALGLMSLGVIMVLKK